MECVFLRSPIMYTAQMFDHVLWHFTGGPKWNQRSQRQATKKKSLEEAYNNLCNIFSSINAIKKFSHSPYVTLECFRY